MRICYFGIYKPDFSRNRIYLKGLRDIATEAHVEVVECTDDSPGLLKFYRLWKKHRALNGAYDVMVVGYPGYTIVPFARLITRKPVISNAICTLWESVILSRQQYSRWSLRYWYVLLVDWLAVHMATLTLVETRSQYNFYQKRFGISSQKVHTLLTGVDDSIFYYDPAVTKHSQFTVLFRGRLLPEAGVTHVLKAAKILESEDISFVILGNGFLQKEIKNEMSELALKNITLVTQQLPYDDLRTQMQKCHVSLGQLEDHERLERTIPHKAFESIAMKLPYITARTRGIQELLVEGESCLMVIPADPQDLAQAILRLKNDPCLAQRLSDNAFAVYERELTPQNLARKLVVVCTDILKYHEHA